MLVITLYDIIKQRMKLLVQKEINSVLWLTGSKLRQKWMAQPFHSAT